MKDKQIAKNQLINELTKLRQRSAKRKKSETRHKQAEETLKESEEKFRNLAEQSPNMIFINKKGRVVYANKKCTEIMGYNMDEFSSPDFDFFYLIAPESVELVKSSFDRHMKGKEVKPLEYTLVTKDGKRVETILSTKLIKYEAASAILGIVTDITERKQAEQALRENEEHYRQLTDSISDIFFEMDKDLICTYWNKASEKLTGISTKDAIGKSLFPLFPDILITRKTKRVYLDVLRTQQPQAFINEYKFGGKNFFFDISAYPSKRGISVFVKDITERMQTEKDLREKEEFNFALFQHNPIQTIVVDRGGRVLKVNMAKRKSGDRLPNIGDVMYKDYAAKHEIDMHAELMECIRSCKKKRFPALKYGDKFLDITIASFPDGAIITSLNITERKRAEEMLKESEEKFRQFFENEPAYCYMISPEGLILDVNKSACMTLGYKKEELVGKDLKKIYAPESRPKMRAHFAKWKKTGKLRDKEMMIITKDGKRRMVLLSAAAVRNKAGEILLSLSVQKDITDRLLAEEEIKNSQ